jgi:hypothetical protein
MTTRASPHRAKSRCGTRCVPHRRNPTLPLALSAPAQSLVEHLATLATSGSVGRVAGEGNLEDDRRARQLGFPLPVCFCASRRPVVCRRRLPAHAWRGSSACRTAHVAVSIGDRVR